MTQMPLPFYVGGVLILLCLPACDSVAVEYATTASVQSTFVDASTTNVQGLALRISTEPRMYGIFTAGDFGRTSMLSAAGTAMRSGVVISTGDVASIQNVDGKWDGFTAGTDFGLQGSPVGDEAFLEFTFTATCSTKLSFRYIFASRELPEFAGTKFNDQIRINVSPGNRPLGARLLSH